MTLAERGVFLDRGKLWVREIRRRTASGHQTAIVSTDFINPRDRLAAPMFGRWGQENFFRYMLEHYGLDRLISYGVEAVPETTRVVNPAHRELDAAVRKRTGVLSRRRAAFGALTLDQPITTASVHGWEQKKASLHQDITALEQEIADLKAQRKETPRHIQVKDLPPEKRFSQLHSASKHFIDTIKMIAYRAETAMVHVLRDVISRPDDARSLLRAVYCNEADLLPDHAGRYADRSSPPPRQPQRRCRHPPSLRRAHRHGDGLSRVKPPLDFRIGVSGNSARSGGLKLSSRTGFIASLVKPAGDQMEPGASEKTEGNHPPTAQRR